MTEAPQTTAEEVCGPDAFWLGIIAEKDAEIARLRAALENVQRGATLYAQTPPVAGGEPRMTDLAATAYEGLGCPIPFKPR